MAYEVIWTASARNDVDEAISYIAVKLGSPRAACEHLEAFVAAAEQLSVMPEMCALSSQPSLARRGLRSKKVKSYVLLYDFNGERVTVHRVFNGLRDYARLIDG